MFEVIEIATGETVFTSHSKNACIVWVSGWPTAYEIREAK